MLAGSHSAQGPLGGNQVYVGWILFNPDRLFSRMLRWLRWIWTTRFFAFSLAFFAAMAFLALSNWAELSNFAGQTLRRHYLAIFFVGWVVAVTHEFAHGLTSKAFGGRATEVEPSSSITSCPHSIATFRGCT
jgi:hypothetical protein